VRCERCGNENPDTNRFCGMCAASLSNPSAPLQRPARAAAASPTAQASLPSLAPAVSPREEARRPSPVHDAPVITGPSFLGLNKPAPGKGPVASQDPIDHLRSSRNLDYLLDDEPEPKRSFGKVLLVLAALALALGFAYLRWKQGGFDWLTGDSKPSTTAPIAESSQPPADTAATPAQSPAAVAAPSPSGTNAGVDSSAATASPSAASPTTSSVSPAANPPASAPATGADSTVPGNATAAPIPAATTPAATTPPDASAAAPPPDADSAPAKTPDADAPPARPSPAKPTPAKPIDPVVSAEKYIYGRGVPQDCDRGLRQLKPAAEQSNPKAMISLGALYSTGVCTPRDLPTAYRWFALALRKQPENASLQDDLQKLWSQMTQPERQLAIKLSQ